MIPLSDTIKNKLNYGLYIVSTPIGNLEDITLRALKVLKKSDYILCEDTRVSKKLLTKYKVSKSQYSIYNDKTKFDNYDWIIDIRHE